MLLKRTSAIFLILMTIASSKVSAEERGNNGDIFHQILNLEKSNQKIKKNELLDNQDKKIEFLINTVKKEKFGLPLHSSMLAIKLLGELRSTEAVEILTKYLNVEPNEMEFMPIGIPTFSIEHPAANSLIQIGLPSIPHVTYNLKKLKNEEEIELSTIVIYKILGFNFAEQTIKNELKYCNADQSVNINKALYYLENNRKKAERNLGGYNEALLRDLYSTIQHTYKQIYVNKLHKRKSNQINSLKNTDLYRR